MTLLELAKTFATDEILTVETNETMADVDSKYHKSTNLLIQEIKPKMSVLNKFRPAYIKQAFEDMGQVKEILEEIGWENGPDGIILHLSSDLYGKHFNDLSLDEQGIIKLLVTYICIVN